MVLIFRDKYIILIIFFIFTIIAYTCGQKCKPLIGLDIFLNTQEHIIEAASEYLYNQKKKMKLLKRFLRRLKIEKKIMESRSSFAKNPINVFAMLKRLSHDYSAMTSIRARISVYERNVSMEYPDYGDLECAVDTMAYLQTFYHLNITELVRGRLVGHYSENRRHYFEEFTPLTTEDCYTIAGTLMALGNHNLALQWYMESLDLFSNSDKHHKMYGFNIIDIVENVSECYYYMGNLEMRNAWAKKLKTTKAIKWLSYNKKPLIARFRDKMARLETNRIQEEMKSIQSILEIPVGYKGMHQNGSAIMYQSLCRGEQELPAYFSKRLTCSYLHEHPFLRVAPIKLEYLYLEPEITLYHDVISDAEIQYVMEVSKINLKSSELAQYMSSQITKSTTLGYNSKSSRSSLTSWIDDTVSPVIRKLSDRISMFTGLSIHFAEFLQVVQYGPGGQFLTHHDWPLSYPDVSKNKTRFATAMFYLSDVEQGGATVFTELGLTVYPKKGSALVWTNHHPSGEWDPSVLHGGCPVLRGSKWVANKWINYPEVIVRTRIDSSMC